MCIFSQFFYLFSVVSCGSEDIMLCKISCKFDKPNSSQDSTVKVFSIKSQVSSSY